MFIEKKSEDDLMYYRLIIREAATPIMEFVPTATDYEFGKLYALNGVVIVGDWIDSDNQTMGYTITAYRDEAHYKEFVEKMKTNEIYQQYTKILMENTVNITNIKLEFTTMMRINFDSIIMENYVQRVGAVLNKSVT